MYIVRITCSRAKYSKRSEAESRGRISLVLYFVLEAQTLSLPVFD